MATRKAAKGSLPTKAISHDQLVEWIRSLRGDMKHEAFAKELGVSRQVLSGVLTGRRRVGAGFCKRLAPFGLVGIRKVYLLTAKPSGKV